ncbi:MAG TPA: methylmalonyl-CoA mutase family protein [Mycobacteriales bacterium]|nr:methylmalonyl-CoA mutase family protein [Mycobacteriales bacterium]
MSAPTDPLPLAAQFPATTREQWVELVAGVLRRSGLPEGADPVEALTGTTYDDIPVRPLYTAADRPVADPGRPGAAPYVRGSTADGPTLTGWDVRPRHANPDPAALRAALLNDLETGATSSWLVLGDAGLPVADLAAALEGVYVELAPVALDAGAQTRAAADAFLALVADRGLDPAEVRGSLGADPIGLRARTGADADLGLLGELAGRGGAGLRVATVDGTVAHDAGASDATELAVATATGVAYLRALTDAGLAVEPALDAIEFRFAVSADQFASIAKLRAARRIWGRVAELSGAAPDRRGQRQHAVTSAAMMTRHDPWVNMLRTTIACFAAAVGGADAITVLPFDAALGLPDDLARRVARNTQAILHDESSLGRVLDAAGGSWYVEAFTDELADKAWDTFTAIERAGGALAALDDGTIGDLVAATRARRADDVAHRRAPLTGVTEYALPDEPAVPRRPAPPPLTGGPLAPGHWAAEYEDLRDAVEAVEPRPAVYLATLGPMTSNAARLGFARGLFQAGGLHVVAGPPEEFLRAGTAVVCLCGTDAAYAAEAAAVIETLREDGARHVWLAGRGELGADGYLYTGCDALAALRTTADLLGVAR